MAAQELKNNAGRVLGKIKESGHYLVLTDVSGRTLGKYDTKNNTTYDVSGRKIGTGNLLASLLISRG
jgi:hypothetical protein